MKYQLESSYKPLGDQPQAIKELTEGIRRGDKHQTFLGVTGSGKTFSVSNVIQNIGRPVLVMSHNKTLAAQLYGEFKKFFPHNRVEFFISYYDYFQPEAYIPSSDTYIQKDLSINDEIDRLRLRATASILEGRKDVIVISSVSCIYGIGAPEEYAEQMIVLKKGQKITRKQLLSNLIDIHYVRNDIDFKRGTFRVRGDTVEIIAAYEDETGIRVEMFDDRIEKISYINRTDGKVIGVDESCVLYPAKYFVTNKDKLEHSIAGIREELGTLNSLSSRENLSKHSELNSVLTSI